MDDDKKKKKDETNEKDSFASFSPDAASLARKTNVAAHSSHKTKHHGKKKHVKKEAVGKSQTPLPFATVGGMYPDDMEEKLHVKQYAQNSAAGVARRPMKPPLTWNHQKTRVVPWIQSYSPVKTRVVL